MGQVSIIIPVKDQPSRLALTLTALERQRDGMADLEVIVVDDGSAVPVQESLARIGLKGGDWLHFLECSSSGARGIPRNLGASAARGDLLLFLDADACPSLELVANHRRRHALTADCIALGDCHVIEATGTFDDPTVGTPFSDARAIASSTPPLLLSCEQLRRLGDSALEPHATKGIYPGQRRLFEQLEQFVSGRSPLAWARAIPHNLSMTRGIFEMVGGFDTGLLDSEGWDFGIRAGRRGISCEWAPGARSFHLFHCRGKSMCDRTRPSATQILLQRYPDAGLEALHLWWSALSGDVYVPAELDMSNLRVMEAWLEQPEGVRQLRAWHAQQCRQPRSGLDGWFESLHGGHPLEPMDTLTTPAALDESKLRNGVPSREGSERVTTPSRRIYND